MTSEMAAALGRLEHIANQDDGIFAVAMREDIRAVLRLRDLVLDLFVYYDMADYDQLGIPEKALADAIGNDQPARTGEPT